MKKNDDEKQKGPGTLPSGVPAEVKNLKEKDAR